MITLEGPLLLKSLGRWVAPSLRIWRYWYNDETEEIKAIGEKETVTFSLDRSKRGRGKQFQLAQTLTNGDRDVDKETDEAASVTITPDNRASLICVMRKTEEVTCEQDQDILDKLESWGGNWMWRKLKFKSNLE